MRIDRLTIQNFDGFDYRELEFQPNFNLLIGDNAAGKTSVLDALTVSLGSWFVGLTGYGKPRRIFPGEIRVAPLPFRDITTFERQFPVRISAEGHCMGQPVKWSRQLSRIDGNTSVNELRDLKTIAQSTQQKAEQDPRLTLPLICSYGTERLWLQSPHSSEEKFRKHPGRLPSRFDGYEKCLDSEIQEHDLLAWVRAQVLVSEQRKEETAALRVIRKAVVDCIEGANRFYYDPRYEDIVIETEEFGAQLFRHLSDGQRIMLSLIGDLARRASTLNPHLEEDTLAKTPGVVLIDELDLHLHPKWQRRVISDLKHTFPSIQFIVTTHSPQLIGEAKSNEILLLEGKGVYHPTQSFGLDSSRVLTEVMQALDRTASVGELTRQIAKLVNDEDFEGAEKLIADLEQIVGENDPEVLRPRGIIRFLETAS